MKTIATFALFLFTLSIFSQNNVLDSLIQVIKNSKEDTNRVNTLNALSLKFISNGRLDTAIYYTGLSRTTAEKIGFKKGEANAMHIKGNIYYSKNNFTEALKTYSASLKIRQEIADTFGMANSHTNIANICFSQGNVTSAYDNFQNALKFYEACRNKAGMATCYNAFGTININLGKYPEALSNFNAAQKIFDELGNKNGIAKCYNNKGVINQYQGNYTEALKQHASALKMREDIGDKSGIAMSHLNIGFNYMYLSRYREALSEFNLTLKISEELKDKKGIATAYNNIGGIYTDQGDYENALKTHMISLKMKEEIGDKYGIGQSYINIGRIYLIQGKYLEALKNFGNGLKLYQEMGDKKNIAVAYNNIGIVHQYQSNYPVAMKNYSQSMKIKQEIGDKRGISESYNNIGNLYYYQGNYPEAFKNFNSSLKILEELGDKKGVATAYNNIGITYKEQANYDEALINYKASFQLKESIGDKNGMGLSYINIGEAYLLQKKYPEALTALSSGLKLGEEIGETRNQLSAYMNIGLVQLQMNNIAEAKNNANLSLKLAREIGSPDFIKNADGLLSKINIKENNLEEAEKNQLDLINICNKSVVVNFPVLSEKEQELYFNTLSTDYMSFNSFALNRKKGNPSITETAYNTAVRNKGLLLKSSTAMRNAILNSKDSILIAKYLDWNTLKKQIAKLYSDGKDANELEEKANSIEKELAKSSQLFSDFSRIQNVTWTNVQKGLKPTEAAIEFIHFNHLPLGDSVSQTVYCALIVKPDSKYPEMIELFKGKDLENILGKFNQNNYSYVSGIYGGNSSPKTELYDLIWKPLESSLKNIKTVYLSPSGLLHKISFTALCRSQNVYLCDNYNIHIQSSTGKVAYPESFIFDEKTKVTIFGGIDYNSAIAPSDSNSFLTWNYLSGTKSEAEKIYQTLKAHKINVNLFEEKTGTENEFKKSAPDNTILHIATHGFFFPDQDEVQKEKEKKEEEQASTKTDAVASRGVEYGFGVWSFVMNKNPLMRSGLVFAGANGVWNQEEQTESEDGVLTAQEVSNIDMRKTGLVVLSACETGLGDIKGSEGVYGLQRSFKMAGAKFIIMSLWQVPDAETEEFMALFYNKLVINKNVKKAFSETQKALRKKYDPFFWAPFVLVE